MQATVVQLMMSSMEELGRLLLLACLTFTPPSAALSLHSLARPAVPSVSTGLATAEPDVDTDSRAFAQLVEAVVSEGGFVGSVSVQTVGGLRGLYVQEDVSAGEPLLAVPRQCILLAVEGDGESDEERELKLHERLMLRLLSSAASGKRVRS